MRFLGRTGSRTEPGPIAAHLDTLRSTLLDVDQNGTADALSDGIVILRHLFGFSGQTLVDGAVDTNGKRTEPSEIALFLNLYNNPTPPPAAKVAAVASPELPRVASTKTQLKIDSVVWNAVWQDQPVSTEPVHWQDRPSESALDDVASQHATTLTRRTLLDDDLDANYEQSPDYYWSDTHQTTETRSHDDEDDWELSVDRVFAGVGDRS